MACTRTAIRYFAIANAAYRNAVVSFYKVNPETQVATTTLGTVYDSPTENSIAANPYTLDAEGKFVTPLYHEEPLIAQVSQAAVSPHSTGIINPATGGFRGDWSTAQEYLPGEFVRDGANGANTGNVYICTAQHTSGTWATDLGNGLWDLAIPAASVNLETGVTGVLPIANGGTNASNATQARINLGLQIGTDVQAQNSVLQNVADANASVGFADGSNSAPSIYFGSDTDTGIYRRGANNLVIACNGANVISATGGSRIGMGVNDPLTKLHVVNNQAPAYTPQASTVITAQDAVGVNASCYVSLIGNDTGYSGLWLGDTSNTGAGRFAYFHGLDIFLYYIGGSERYRIGATGTVISPGDDTGEIRVQTTRDGATEVIRRDYAIGNDDGGNSTFYTEIRHIIKSPTDSSEEGQLDFYVLDGGSSTRHLSLADGQVLAGDGTVSLPSLAFFDDTNTGIYRIGSNNIGFSAGGVKSGEISTLGLWTLGSGSAGVERLNVQGAIRASSPSAGFTSGVEATFMDFETSGNSCRIGHVPGASGSARNVQFWNNSAMIWYYNQGLVVGTPTGGDKGVGTINAQNVYDDNVLLTCYVLEAWLDGDIDSKKWDSAVPDKKWEEFDFLTGKSKKRLQKRKHDRATGFASVAKDRLDIEKFSQYLRDNRHLPAFPGFDNWKDVHDFTMSTGDVIQRLWETVELQSVFICEMHDRLKTLEQ